MPLSLLTASTRKAVLSDHPPSIWSHLQARAVTRALFCSNRGHFGDFWFQSYFHRRDCFAVDVRWFASSTARSQRFVASQSSPNPLRGWALHSDLSLLDTEKKKNCLLEMFTQMPHAEHIYGFFPSFWGISKKFSTLLSTHRLSIINPVNFWWCSIRGQSQRRKIKLTLNSLPQLILHYRTTFVFLTQVYVIFGNFVITVRQFLLDLFLWNQVQG